MSLTSLMKDWLNSFYQDHFIYRDGFLRFPYRGASPDLLLASFKKIPFVKYDKKRQRIFTDNPFFKGGFYLQQLEDDCWLMFSKMKYNANVCFDLRKGNNDMNRFYMVSLNMVKSKPIIYKEFSDKRITFPSISWTFAKPTENTRTKYLNLNFTGAKNRSITLFFTEEWMQKNIVSNTLFSTSKLYEFIQSEQRFLYSPFQNEAFAVEQMNNFEVLFGEGREEEHKNDVLCMKMNSLSLLWEFLKYCQTAELVMNHYAIDDYDQEVASKVATYLDQYLLDDFVGTEVLAKKFKITEAKMQRDFKRLKGISVFQYFQEQRMLLAKELLRNKNTQVKEVAYKFGYKNAGKFSIAFKKYHGVLPSEM